VSTKNLTKITLSLFLSYKTAIPLLSITICVNFRTKRLPCFHLMFAQNSFGGLDGETVNEQSPVTDTPRAKKLINAEAACLKEGGVVLRLAGLYTLERGAHNYWLTSGKDVDGRADGIINLLHYDDAAGACLNSLKEATKKSAVYLISDGNPLTREQICLSARKSALYSDKVMPAFLGTDKDAMGKVYDGSWSNEALNWKPRYISFDSFMEQH